MNQTNQLTTYRVKLPDGSSEDIRAEAVAIRDGAAVFLVGGQPVEILAHDTWRRIAGSPVPAEPARAREPMLIPATNPI